MNLVDSSGWLEYFADGANADFFAAPIDRADDLVVPTIAVLEVFRRMRSQRGRSSAYRAIGHMRRGQLIDLDRKLAVAAAQIGFDRKLATADSIILATANLFNATIWTQDADFVGVAGVRYRAKR